MMSVPFLFICKCKNYRFPEELSLRESWMEALGQTDWEPEPGSIICSKHFVVEDFLKNLDRDYSMTSCNVKVCRICFTTDDKMYSLTACNALNNAYETFTGLSTADEEHLPRYLCAGCADRLMNCARFRRRSLRAHLMLLDVVRRHGQITIELVQSVMETNNSFNSDSVDNSDDFGLDNGHLVEVNKLKDTQDDTRPERADIYQYVNNIKSEIDAIIDTDKTDNVTISEVKSEYDLDNQEDIDNCSPNSQMEIRADNDETRDDINICSLSLKKDDVDVYNQDVNDEITCNDVILESSPKIENSSSAMENELSFISVGKDVSEERLPKQEMRRKTRKVLPRNVLPRKAKNTLQYINEMYEDIQQTPGHLTRGDITYLGAFKTLKYENQQHSHLTTTHFGEKPYSCEFCTKVFRTKRNLKSHMITHSAEKPHSCPVCNKAFRHKYAIKAHLLTHTDEKPFSCQICRKKFKSKHCRRLHLKIHSDEEPLSCHLCEKTFKRKGGLRNHLVTHSDEMRYSCDVCGKEFYNKFKLQSHSIAHSNERPYSCDVCKKSFKRSYNLQTHSVIHSGVKAFSCEICRKKYRRKDKLKAHLRIHFDE